MSYVDGFIVPLKTENVADYKKMSKKAGKIWREHGALDYRECALDDAIPHCGVPFGKIAKAKEGETVIFAWILYKSKAHRNQVNKAVMADPRMDSSTNPMPFDGKRMIYGGFQMVMQA